MGRQARTRTLGALFAGLLVAAPATPLQEYPAALPAPPVVRWEPPSPTDGSAMAITVEAPEGAGEMCACVRARVCMCVCACVCVHM